MPFDELIRYSSKMCKWPISTFLKKRSKLLVIGKMKTKTAEIPSHPSQDVYRQGNK